MTTPVDELRSAAVLLRQRAEAATPGPWWFDEDEMCWRLHGVAFRIPGDDLIPEQIVNSQILKAPKHGTPYAEYWPNAADSAWIVTMNPLVGLALADWLDARAAYAEGRTAATVAQWDLLADIADAAVEHAEPHALKLARLINGGGS